MQESNHLRHGRDDRQGRDYHQRQTRPRLRIRSRSKNLPRKVNQRQRLPSKTTVHRPGRSERWRRNNRIDRRDRRTQSGTRECGCRPGTAAYGKAGRQATVTDANIVAGRINPTQLLSGNLQLHYDLAVEAIGRLSRTLGISVEKMAERILRIVNNNMSRALRLVSIERGRDPREYTLISFGGAGPLHACDLAEEL